MPPLFVSPLNNNRNDKRKYRTIKEIYTCEKD